MCGESYTDGKDIADAPVCQHRDADDNERCDVCGESYTDGKDVGEHVHYYIVESTDEKFLKSEASIESAATYYYSCLCGAIGSETFTHGEPLPVTYRVTFDFANGQENITANYNAGAKLNKITPIKNGYTFVEWQYNGKAWSFDTDAVASDMTLVAIWQKSAATLGNISYNTSKTAISEYDEITAALFGATCYYSDGTPALVEIAVSGTQTAGNTVNIRFYVTDESETKQVTVKNVKVYGAPTLDYDKSVDWVNIQRGLNKETFSATAKDTFGGEASISLSISGSYKAGDTVTVLITATDVVGNKTTAEIEGVKAYAAPTIVCNTSKSCIKISDTINADLFEAYATDSFGGSCTVALTCDNVKSGATVTVVITATDSVGNVATKNLSGIKVYGTPTVKIDPFIYDYTDISFIAVVKDSFGNELTPEITYVGDLCAGSTVVVTVKATDKVGNTVERSYTYVVNHDSHSWVDGYCSVCSKACPYDMDGDYIYFGEYPQTIKADDITITDTQDARGYYLGSDGYYYAKVTATPNSSGYTFSTGASVTSGEVYYFKVEPIRWRILSTDGKTALILCDSIIANHRYDDSYNNNYAQSEIRQWLNDTFYESAFSDLQREIILTTTVDNSVYSTGDSSNSYACEDTEDKVFLLSYREVTSSAYGFASNYSTYNTARRMQTSDYSRATGVLMNTSSTYYGNGSWWLRSPNYHYGNDARYVYYGGNVGSSNSVSGSYFGVVAALQIRLQA